MQGWLSWQGAEAPSSTERGHRRRSAKTVARADVHVRDGHVAWVRVEEGALLAGCGGHVGERGGASVCTYDVLDGQKRMT